MTPSTGAFRGRGIDRVSKPFRAFTLVELLAVIAIIGVLVGLLLPAVQAARESARRMTCSNSVKQWSMAVQNYMDSHGRIPTVGEKVFQMTTQSYAGAARETYGAFPALLPFVEQNELYDRIVAIAKTWNCQNNSAAQNPPAASLFRCPSEPTARVGSSNYNTFSYRLNWGDIVVNENLDSSPTPSTRAIPTRRLLSRATAPR